MMVGHGFDARSNRMTHRNLVSLCKITFVMTLFCLVSAWAGSPAL